jgi:hypothetical protein
LGIFPIVYSPGVYQSFISFFSGLDKIRKEKMGVLYNTDSKKKKKEDTTSNIQENTYGGY